MEQRGHAGKTHRMRTRLSLRSTSSMESLLAMDMAGLEKQGQVKKRNSLDDAGTLRGDKPRE